MPTREEMAENSLQLVEECDIVMGHVFPYSPKRGTPAARMPQVPAAAIKERASRLREATARQRSSWLRRLIGTRQNVLVERENGFGHAESFAPVRVVGGNWTELGEVIRVTIAALHGETLVGVPE